MELQSLNLITIIIFFVVLGILWFLSYIYITKTLKFNRDYKLLSVWKYFYIKYIFLFLSFFIVFLSIFWIKYWDKQIKNDDKWIDMMFVLDVSKSMNTYDIQDSNNLYSRLYIAKKAISDFVINHSKDRFWLVIFAWDAVSTVPLTSDHDIFLTFLDNVDYRNLVVQWSDFEKALDLWVARFYTDEDRSKALVFISDGWDKEDQVNYSNIKTISQKIKWINYFVAWIWTKPWWKIIAWTDVFGRQFFEQYNWAEIISKLNETNLQDIANVINWQYLKISKVDDLLNLNKYINNLEKKSFNQNTTWEQADFSRNLTIFSFIFFVIFLIYYIFENKFYLLKSNKYE